MKTTVVPIDASKLGSLTAADTRDDLLDEFLITLDQESVDARQLQQAAEALRTSDIPIAFPTETVYGLGADATRSQAVRGIYKAKQRPSDNPLIVHFASLRQIRDILSPNSTQYNEDPIPAVYRPLIQAFWPGPLTILLPNPKQSKLAPEVTAGLDTFGARIPSHPIALALIHLADRPVAAPSANASTKPSPTAAEHVAFDLDGRIETILDGGPCEVGVESTVVDGLCDPPVLLRPGGISLEQIRACPGWEQVTIGYKDTAEIGERPRAPGMKYRHYSPRAPVLLYRATADPPTLDVMFAAADTSRKVGLIRTRSWTLCMAGVTKGISNGSLKKPAINGSHDRGSQGFQRMLNVAKSESLRRTPRREEVYLAGAQLIVFDIDLGRDPADIARGIFGGLRDLDRENVEAIYVEGIDDAQNDLAAAIMNRLRKAAEVTV